MRWSLATTEQLFQIATDEDCSLHLKYEAARRLQNRKFQPCMLLDLVRMYPIYVPSEIAEHLGISYQKVEAKAKELGLKRTEVLR
jgi:hypothetical protein